MLKNKAKSLAQLAGSPDSGLGRLAEAARVRSDLSDYLRNHLDPTVAAGFVHCNIRDEGNLVVTAASPEWASRLRFEAASISELCAAHGTPVKSVRFRVSAAD